MNRIIKLVAWICLLACVVTCVGCEKKPEPQPILKVITSSQIGVTIFSYKHYYIVYNNRRKKKISKFSPSKSISYAFNPDAESKDEPYLHLIDTTTDEGITLNNIAKNIFLLTEKDDNNNVFSPGKLIIIDSHYYFTALVKKSKNSIDNGLYEYLFKTNSFQNIATFSSSITHVEPYQ